MTEEEIAEECRLIRTEEDWPLWPILPVKNTQRNAPGHPEDEKVGIVWVGLSDVPFRVHLLTLFDLKPSVPLGEQFAKVRHLDFASVEEAVRAGWIGD